MGASEKMIRYLLLFSMLCGLLEFNKANSQSVEGTIGGAAGGAVGPGTGDVVGPASATDNCFVKFNGTTGKLVANSVICLDGSGNVVTSSGYISGNGGSVAGFHQMGQGTARTPGANSVVRQAPASVPTAYSITEPSAAATGFLFGTNVAGVMSSAYIQPWTVNPQTATYQALAADFASCKTIAVASGTFTITLVASGSQPPDGQCLYVVNYGTGAVTIARSGQNINGATATIPVNKVTGMVRVVSDGTNYHAASTFANPMTTAGDILYTNASGLTSKLAVGAATEVLHGSATVPVYAAVVEGDFGFTDITTANVSTTKHGLTPKLPNDATKYLNGTGAYTVPAGGGSSGPSIGYGYNGGTNVTTSPTDLCSLSIPGNTMGTGGAASSKCIEMKFSVINNTATSLMSYSICYGATCTAVTGAVGTGNTTPIYGSFQLCNDLASTGAQSITPISTITVAGVGIFNIGTAGAIATNIDSTTAQTFKLTGTAATATQEIRVFGCNIK